MKAFILKQFSLLKDQNILNDTFKVTTWLLSLVISAYLLISLSVPLFESSTHKGHVFATDNDGGRAIETSMATKWYNSNHFAPYGNLYYRLSHTLADLVPLHAENLNEIERKERAHNFSLKLISLFSLYALGFYLGFVLFGISFLSPLFATFFSLVVIKMPMWSEWVFRPHPDHLLNVFIAIAIYHFAKFLADKNNVRNFILSAMIWGLAMAVKRSTSIFIPGILLMLQPFNKESFLSAVKYIGYMLLAYLLVGFPQNFGLYKHIKFLLYESSLHSRGDLASITMNLKIVGNQLLYLVPVVAAGTFFSKNREKLFSVKMVIFVVISFVPILMRKMSFGGDHHTMPLAVATSVLIMIAIIHHLPFRISQSIIAGVILLSGIKFFGISDKYFEWKKNQTRCLQEFDQIEDIIGSNISQDNQVIREPYFPSRQKFDAFTRTNWGLSWNLINKNIKYFGVSRRSANEHLSAPPSDYYGKMVENWDLKTKFYNDINNRNQVISPDGVSYKKVFTGKLCDHELWERVDKL